MVESKADSGARRSGGGAQRTDGRGRSTLVVDQIASGVPDVPLFQKGVATMITKECFGCGKVTSHEHSHDCAPGIPGTHIVGSERFVCVLCKHVTFAGSDGASRFPFTFDKVAAGRWGAPKSGDPRGPAPIPSALHHQNDPV